MSHKSEPLALRMFSPLVRIAVYSYPAQFRARFGRDVIDTYRDSARAEYARRGPLGLLRIAARLLGDLTLQGFGERLTPTPPPFHPNPQDHPMLDNLFSDLRYSTRRLAASPGFTLAAALCVAVGVGANTTIFSLVDAILLRPLPGVTEPASLLEVGRSQDGSGSDTFGYPAITALMESSATVDIAGWNFTPVALGGDGVSEAALGMQVTDNYLDVLGAPLQLGRGFAPGESSPVDGAAVIVLSDSVWPNRYSADPLVLGRQVRVNGTVATVIGVVGPGFGGTYGVIRAEAWVPFGMVAGGFASADSLNSWPNNFVLGVGRLRQGVGIEAAREELGALMAGLVDGHPDAMRGQGVVVNPLGGLPVNATGSIQLFMAVLMAVVGVVLAVACINVAGMIAARSMSRGREVAVRLALGARRGRLVRQLLTESLLLVGLGGAIGVGVSVLATRAIRAADLPIPPPFDIALVPHVDLRVFGFAMLVTAIAGVVAGLGPALRCSRPDLVPALKADVGFGRPRLFGRRALVAAQVAATIVLVVTAGLFLRALGHAGAIDLGFEPEGVFALSLDTDLTALPDAAAIDLLSELAAGTRALPGVTDASVSALLPLGLPTSIGLGGLTVAGFEPPAGSGSYDARVNIVAAAYFDTMRIALRAGGDFDAQLTRESPSLAIINAHMADFFWPDGDAVGGTFALGESEYTVRGVAADSRYRSLTEDPSFFIYVSHAQTFRAQTFLIARINGDAAGPVAGIRSLAAALAPDLSVLDVVALRSYADLGLLPQRVAAALAGAMGVVVLILAAVGIYGVTAQTARRRIRSCSCWALPCSPASLCWPIGFLRVGRRRWIR